MNEIKLPELGEGIEKATLACWHFQPGDEVNTENDLCEVVTDKATFNIPIETDGTLKEIYFAEGDEIAIGATIAIIE